MRQVQTHPSGQRWAYAQNRTIENRLSYDGGWDNVPRTVQGRQVRQ